MIGVGSELVALNQVAAAGGTNNALIVSAGNAANEFLDALNEIRGAVGCVYKIPVPTGGGEPDLTKLNVVFKPNGGTPETFPNVASAADCMGKKAWYYDDNANPTQIILCPAACDLVSNQAGPVVVELGQDLQLSAGVVALHGVHQRVEVADVHLGLHLRTHPHHVGRRLERRRAVLDPDLRAVVRHGCRHRRADGIPVRDELGGLRP